MCFFILSKTLALGENEWADSAAKFALNLPRAKVGVPYNDFKHCISQYILSTWQDDWNGAVTNKLHSVKPDLSLFYLCGLFYSFYLPIFV